jgi:hypothetical protein
VFRVVLSIVDVEGDDDFGDRVEAASAGCDEAYKLDRGRNWRSEASSLLAALMCVFLWQRDFPYPRNLVGGWKTVTWASEIAIVLRVYSSRD